MMPTAGPALSRASVERVEVRSKRPDAVAVLRCEIRRLSALARTGAITARDVSDAHYTIFKAVEKLQRERDDLRRELARTQNMIEKYVERVEAVISDRAADGHLSVVPVGEIPTRGFCVYVLWADTTPLYVGSSQNVLARVGSHLGEAAKRRAVTRVTITRYETRGAMLDAERALIERYNPPLNIVGVKREAS
jgi:hypothetical protein